MRRFSMLLVVGALLAGPQLVPLASHRADPPCSVNPSPVAVGQTYRVSVSGLPTGTAINLWITNANGTVGQPLGSTPTGSFDVAEQSSVAGATSYAFSGPVRNNMTVYATCSVQAS